MNVTNKQIAKIKGDCLAGALEGSFTISTQPDDTFYTCKSCGKTGDGWSEFVKLHTIKDYVGGDTATLDALITLLGCGYLFHYNEYYSRYEIVHRDYDERLENAAHPDGPQYNVGLRFMDKDIRCVIWGAWIAQPRWSKKEIDEIKVEAEKTRKLIGWE